MIDSFHSGHVPRPNRQLVANDIRSRENWLYSANITTATEQRSVFVGQLAAEMNAHSDSAQIAGSIPDGIRTGFQIKIPIVLGIFGKFSVKNRNGDDGHLYCFMSS
jgi:hypothetical protein